MGFRRFWARREPCVVQKAPILVGSTSPVFAPYCSSRLTVGCSKARAASARTRTASQGAPYETRIENSYWAFESPYVAHKTISCNGTQSGTRTAPYDCLRAFYGPKIVGSPCWKVVQEHTENQENTCDSCIAGR